jgi:Family of unknown function (DUF6527)
MSDAVVLFHRLDLYDENGDRVNVVSGEEQTFSFACPKYKRRCGDLVISGRTPLKHDGNNNNDGVAQWNWDGNRVAPTFTPSINCVGCWHGFIRNGRCVTVNGVDEPELT